MKKLITLLLAGMLCVTAAACSGSQETENTATADSAQVTGAEQNVEPEDLVVSEKYYNVYAYDEKDPNVKAQDTVTAYEYEFDSEGHAVKTTAVIDGKTESVKESSYDADGNMTEQIVCGADGSKTFTYTFEYDDNHHKTKEVARRADGDLSFEITYTYDENGCLNSENYQSSDYAYSTEYENENGKALASVQYDSNGVAMFKTEYEYDADGRVIRENQSYDYDGYQYSSKVEYEYDDRGNKVKEVSYDADGKILYSYDRVYKTVKELSGNTNP